MLLNQFEMGQFLFTKEHCLRDQSRCVPNKPGVYLIYGLIQGDWKLAYFGKAGMSKTGRLYYQGLLGRLNNTHHNLPRERYLNSKMVEDGFETLKIIWIVTWDEKNKINPCDLESELYRISTPLWNMKRGRKKLLAQTS